MPLPTPTIDIILTSETFNDWFDATNNLISYVTTSDGGGNAINFVVTNANTTGNITLAGTATMTRAIVSGNTVIYGDAVGNAVIAVSNTGGQNTVSITTANLIVTATNTVFSGAGTLSFAPTITGLLAVSANTTLAVTNVTGVFSTNNQLVLSGPYTWSTGFVQTASVSGAGPFSALSIGANSAVYKISSDSTDVVVAGIAQANTSQHRQVIVLNTGNNDIYFQHANTTAGANGILCPSDEDYLITRNSGTMFYYDPTVTRWRIFGGVRPTIANTTISGYVSTTTQTFAGNKTFQDAASFSNTVSITGGVSGAVNALSTLGVSGAVNALSTLGVSGAVNALSTLGVGGAVNALSTLGVSGAVNALSTLGVSGAVNALSTLGVSGAVNALSTLGVTGAASFSNTVSITGDANALSTLGVSGTLTALGQLIVTTNAAFDTNTLIVDATNNRVGVGVAPTYTLDVSGTARVTRAFSNTVTLSDGATVSLDASLGHLFYLSAVGNRTIAAPTNPVDGQKIIIKHYASGANRTLTLNTTASGSFRYGTDITGLTATTSGTFDYIGCVYESVEDRWDVVAYVKGY